MRTFLITAVLVFPGAALAEDPAYEIWESHQLMQAEMDRAQKLGGYSDPLTALSNISKGVSTERDITTGYSDLRETPAFGGPDVSAPDSK